MVDNSNQGNTTDSYNDSSDNSIGSIAENYASLSGEVSGNTADFGSGDYNYDTSNVVDNGAFAGASGLNQNVQNNGANSLVQQQVNFQGNINVNQ